MTLSSSASNSPRTLKAQSQILGLIASAGRLAPKDSNEDAASSSQAWQADVNLNSSAGRLAPTRKTQRVIDKDWPNNFEISASVLGHLEKVYSNLRRNARSQCELVDMEIVYVCDEGCSRSSWSELPREFTVHPITNERKSNCSKCHRSWFRIKKKSTGYLRLIEIRNNGEGHLC